MFSSPLCFRQARSKMDQNQDAVTQKIDSFGKINPIQDSVIMDDTSNMANFTTTSNNQDAVIKMHLNVASSMIESMDYIHQDAVNQKFDDQDAVTSKVGWR